jgi:Tol biopolymer transport system component
MPRASSARLSTAVSKLGVMFMNRIAPSSSVLYVANADGSNERQLLTRNNSVFEYHVSFSPDGEWITFTTEHTGDGQSDIYRVRTDGSEISGGTVVWDLVP